jgi:hypothetical protein
LPANGEVYNISDTSDIEDQHWSEFDEVAPTEISITSEDDEEEAEPTSLI